MQLFHLHYLLVKGVVYGLVLHTLDLVFLGKLVQLNVLNCLGLVEAGRDLGCKQLFHH